MIIIIIVLLACLIVSYTYDVCVIGSGVGGLVAASRLAQQGLQVILLEKSCKLGGRMTSEYLTFSNQTYRFDTGPSLLLLPNVYKSAFADLGYNLTAELELKAVSPFYRCFFENNGSIDLDCNINEVINKYESNNNSNFLKFQEISESFLNFGLPNIIEEKLSFDYVLDFIIACIKFFPLLNFYDMLKKYFISDNIRSAMSFQTLYVGLSPFNSPAIFSLLQALEFSEGIFYPKGGFVEIANLLEKICKDSGVTIVYNCIVKQMIIDESKNNIDSLIITNTLTNDSYNVSATRYLTNIDLPQSDVLLLSSNSNLSDQRATSMDVSCGIMQFHFALDKQINELSHHTLFLSNKFKESWKIVEATDELFVNNISDVCNLTALNFYVHAPSRTDEAGSVCPIGHDAITVLVPVRPLQVYDNEKDSKHFSEEIIKQVRQVIIRRIQSVIDPNYQFSNHVVIENYRTPNSWKSEFGLFRGSAFGLRHSLKQLSILRPSIRHPNIKNLYRVGASTKPGNGVPLVMIGAKLASEVILSDIMK